MMKAAGEEGVSLVFFFRVKAEFQQQAQDGTGSNGLQYLVHYVQNAPNDPSIQHCFKAVPFVDNIKDLGLGSVAGYNGKPALIKKTGQIYEDEAQHSFEMQINVHNFGIMTRSALGSLKGRFKVRVEAKATRDLTSLTPPPPFLLQDMQARVAFTIEGRTDATLPEMVFGCADLHNLDIVECTRWNERGSTLVDDDDSDDDAFPSGGPVLSKHASAGSIGRDGSPAGTPEGTSRRYLPR
jgi:hypothetical protein